LTKTASNLKEYGLDPPQVEVGFRAKGKPDPAADPAGGENPDRRRSLRPGARKPSACSLVNSFLDSTFNKNTFALRDKKVLAFEREKVDSLELSSADKTLQFAKKETSGRW
jgi:hypothetical protein